MAQFVVGRLSPVSVYELYDQLRSGYGHAALARLRRGVRYVFNADRVPPAHHGRAYRVGQGHAARPSLGPGRRP